MLLIHIQKFETKKFPAFFFILVSQLLSHSVSLISFSMDDLARDDYVHCAKLCKFIENYDEMMITMVNLVNKLTPSDDLNRVERHLLLVPFYKKLIVLRNAWRDLSIVEVRNNRASIIKEFRSKVKDARGNCAAAF